MKLSDLLKSAAARVLVRAQQYEHAQVRNIIAADLMSDVLMTDAEHPLLVTSLATDQSLRTAHVIGAAGVLVVNDKALPSSMAPLATELDLTLARTQLSKYDAIVRMGRLMDPA